MAADLDALARSVIDANTYMTLGTRQPDGGPRLSPVYFTPARYEDFYWMSRPGTQHSRNIAAHPEVEIVIYDSTVRVGSAQAVYIAATAGAVPDDELDAHAPEAFTGKGGARVFTADEIRASPFLLYVARATSYAVHVSDPDEGDHREPADPRRLA